MLITLSVSFVAALNGSLTWFGGPPRPRPTQRCRPGGRTGAPGSPGIWLRGHGHGGAHRRRRYAQPVPGRRHLRAGGRHGRIRHARRLAGLREIGTLLCIVRDRAARVVVQPVEPEAGIVVQAPAETIDRQLRARLCQVGHLAGLVGTSAPPSGLPLTSSWLAPAGNRCGSTIGTMPVKAFSASRMPTSPATACRCLRRCRAPGTPAPPAARPDQPATLTPCCGAPGRPAPVRP